MAINNNMKKKTGFGADSYIRQFQSVHYSVKYIYIYIYIYNGRIHVLFYTSTSNLAAIAFDIFLSAYFAERTGKFDLSQELLLK